MELTHGTTTYRARARGGCWCYNFDPEVSPSVSAVRPGAGEDVPMSGARAQFVFALLAASVCLAAAKPAFGTERHPAQKQPVKQEPAVPQPPPGPLVPLTLEGMPAMPPEVS
jgi:hypothetical protein